MHCHYRFSLLDVEWSSTHSGQNWLIQSYGGEPPLFFFPSPRDYHELPLDSFGYFGKNPYQASMKVCWFGLVTWDSWFVLIDIPWDLLFFSARECFKCFYRSSTHFILQRASCHLICGDAIIECYLNRKPPEQYRDVATYIPRCMCSVRTGDSWASNPPEGTGRELFWRKEDVGPSLILPCSLHLNIWLGTFINHQDNILTSQCLNGKTWTIHVSCFIPWWCQP